MAVLESQNLRVQCVVLSLFHQGRKKLIEDNMIFCIPTTKHAEPYQYQSWVNQYNLKFSDIISSQVSQVLCRTPEEKQQLASLAMSVRNGLF